MENIDNLKDAFVTACEQYKECIILAYENDEIATIMENQAQHAFSTAYSISQYMAGISIELMPQFQRIAEINNCPVFEVSKDEKYG